MFDLGSLNALAASMAVKHSPFPWHVRLASYRFILPPVATIPQALANEWTEIMQRAMYTWAKGDVLVPDYLYIDQLTDEQVKRRIAGYQKGYDKEYDRRAISDLWSDLPDSGQERYIFADMPMSLQRAIASLWDGAHHRWMAANRDVRYHPDFGYYWVIEECGIEVKVKMFECDRTDGKPTKVVSLTWEEKGRPGGTWGHHPSAIEQPSPATWRFYVTKGIELLELAL